MQKMVVTLFICLTFFASALSAKEYITYEDFVHFTPKQKRETIKLVHKFLIEYENTAIIERFNKKKKAKYQTYLKIFNYFNFISSAHAASFADLTSESNTENEFCLYAGWVSVVQFSNGEAFCKHPRDAADYIRNRNFRNSELINSITANYNSLAPTQELKIVGEELQLVDLDSNGVNSCQTSNDKVLCNPSLFGRPGGNPICVSGNESLGINSSLLCQQALETIRSQNEGEYLSIMNGIAENATGAGQDEFFYVLNSVYDTCLCSHEGGESEYFSGTINQNYAQKLFTNRTCVGLLAQTENITEYLDTNGGLCTQFQNTTPRITINENNTSFNDYAQKVSELVENLSIKQLAQRYAENPGNFREVLSERDRRSINARDANDLREHVNQIKDLRPQLCPVARRDPARVSFRIVIEEMPIEDSTKWKAKLKIKKFIGDADQGEHKVKADLDRIQLTPIGDNADSCALSIDGVSGLADGDFNYNSGLETSERHIIIPKRELACELSASIEGQIEGADVTPAQDSVPALENASESIEYIITLEPTGNSPNEDNWLGNLDIKKKINGEETSDFPKARLIGAIEVSLDDAADSEKCQLSEARGFNPNFSSGDERGVRVRLAEVACPLIATLPENTAGIEPQATITPGHVEVPANGDSEDNDNNIANNCPIKLIEPSEGETNFTLALENPDTYPSDQYDVSFVIKVAKSLDGEEEEEERGPAVNNINNVLRDSSETAETDEEEELSEAQRQIAQIEAWNNGPSYNAEEGFEFEAIDEENTYGIIATVSTKGDDPEIVCRSSLEKKVDAQTDTTTPNPQPVNFGNGNRGMAPRPGLILGGQN